MTYAELVHAVQQNAADKVHLNLPEQDVRDLLNSLVNVVNYALANGDDVSVSGLGKFEAHKRNARDGRNPSTGAAMHFPEKYVPRFKAASRLKDSAAA